MIRVKKRDREELRRMRAKLDGARGEGVANHNQSLVFFGAGGTTLPRDVATIGCWAFVTGATRDGSNWRWTYQVKRAKKTGAGYQGTWDVRPNAPTWTAYATVESKNTTTGRLGNGVNVADLGSCSVQPFQSNYPVWVRPVPIGNGVIELWFEYANGVSKT
jgi:hypothetical protein